MKKWIVSETDEVRIPMEDKEYYLSNAGHFQWSMGLVNDPRSILSVTEVPSWEEMKDKITDFCRIHNFVPSHIFTGAMACYNLLFGEEKKEKCWCEYPSPFRQKTISASGYGSPECYRFKVQFCPVCGKEIKP